MKWHAGNSTITARSFPHSRKETGSLTLLKGNLVELSRNTMEKHGKSWENTS